MTTPQPPAAGSRERILAAAFETFMQHGYAGAATQDIARRARVSKRDLYAQFGSKQAMLAACIASRVERMQTPLRLPAPGDRASLVATLVAFGTRLLQEVSQPEVLTTYRLAILETTRAPEVAHTLDRLGARGSHDALARLLAGARSAGLVGPGRPEEMAETFLALLWAGALLPRLLLGVARPPSARAAGQRAAAAADKLMRLYATSPQ